MKIILICSVQDRSWTSTLLEPLQAAKHTVDLVTPDNAPRAIAGSSNSALVVVVSPESALGATADWLERIWRPFLGYGGMVIPCLVPDAPPGHKNWMPFDLYTQVPIMFSDPGATQQLLARLTPHPQPAPKSPSRTTSARTATTQAKITTNMNSQPTTTGTLPPVTLPPPPPDSDEIFDADDLLQEPPQMTVVNYALSIVGGFVLVVVIWLAALQRATPGGPSLLLWIGGLALVVGSLFTLGQIELARRKRKAYIEQRYEQARRYGQSDIKPQVFVEVVQSFREEEIGLVWEMRGSNLTIGSRFDAGVPLVAHTNLDATIAAIFYENGLYFIENTSREMALQLVDQQVNPTSTAVINNGDLITLTSVILQFRIDVS